VDAATLWVGFTMGHSPPPHSLVGGDTFPGWGGGGLTPLAIPFHQRLTLSLGQPSLQPLLGALVSKVKMEMHAFLEDPERIPPSR
jgi:hypothetical protein